MFNTQQLMDLGLSADRQELTRRVERIAGDLGFGLFQGVWVRGRFGSPGCELIACGNPPAAYLESAVSLDDSVRDPLLVKLLARSGHVAYDHRLYLEAGARDLYDHQASFGYRCGVGVSMHHASHEDAFIFGLDGPDQLPSDPVAVMRLQGALSLLTVHVQATLQRLTRAAGAASPVESLTRAEAGALRSAAATVLRRRGHLTLIEASPELGRAVRKVDARSAAAVVLRAIEGGLIQP